LTSASSKTAIGLAFLLHKRKMNHSIKILGLTSQENVNFVSNLGLYDEVISYDAIDDINKEKSSIIDFSGNNKTQLLLQKRLGDNYFIIV